MPRLILFSTLNPETLRQLNLLRKPTDDEDRRKLQRHRKLFAVVLLVGVATASLLTNQKLDLMIGTERVRLQQLERKLFAGEDLTDAERTEFCRLLKIVKQVFLADCTADNIAAYFNSDQAFIYDFEPPKRERHKASAIPARPYRHRYTRDKNSVADNTVNFSDDLEYINRGLAAELPNGKFKLPNGRIYSTHANPANKSLYPVSGPGIYVLDFGQFWLLGNMNKLKKIRHPHSDSLINRMIDRTEGLNQARAKIVRDIVKSLH